ncbi:Pro-apoptotic serine protease [Yarrowia sp. C11]|nr:Pro-apoptotic serine protease [Yarrowia sp. E02]KAG5373036.1 Pro-apoptotic serine protease [Yarrowia sp. C11]
MSLQDDSSIWQDVISRTVKSIVSVSFRHYDSVEYDHPRKSTANGFVVDKKQGIVLVNRHVACSAVFSGKIKFHNSEECRVEVLYCDPIHDFGFLKFDPKNVEIETIGEISLRPDLARVGTEVRIVGNDSYQQLSILSGFISQVQRNVFRGEKHNGDDPYCDFNTFYMHATTSYGTSGSPVINIDGYAVGLQAGGRTYYSTDYFLPLQKVKRALEIVRKGGQVSRGCFQTIWEHTAFNSCSHYGLPEDIEGRIRNKYPDNVGMLVAKYVVKNGNSDKKILVGDILVSVDGEDVVDFSELDRILDESVNKSLSIEVLRNSKLLKFYVLVADLHTLSYNEFVKFGGMTFHNMTYQLVQFSSEPFEGVFVACGGPTNVICRSKLFKIDGREISSLAELKGFCRKAVHGQWYMFEFKQLQATFRVKNPAEKNIPVRFDLHFFPDFVSARKDGRWTVEKLSGSNGTSTRLLPSVIRMEKVIDEVNNSTVIGGKSGFGAKVEEDKNENDTEKAATEEKKREIEKSEKFEKSDKSEKPEKPEKPEKFHKTEANPSIPTVPPHTISHITSLPYSNILQSFVTVTVAQPINCDSRELMGYDNEGNPNHYETERKKTGYVIDKDLGIILTANAVFSYFSTLHITFFDQVRLPVSIKYIDVQQNFALLQYDPSMIVAPITEPRVSSTKKNNFGIGEKMHLFVSNSSQGVCSRKDDSFRNFRYSSHIGKGSDTLLVERELEADTFQMCGILTDPETDELIGMAGCREYDKSRVRGVHEVHRVLEKIRNKESLSGKRFLNVYFTKSSFLHARECGLSEERALECTRDGGGGVYSVVFASSDTGFKTGDLLLQIEGRNVTEEDLEVFSSLEKFEVLVLRDSKELTLKVETIPASVLLSSRLFLWCGHIVQKPWIDVWQIQKSEWPSEMIIFDDMSRSVDARFVTHVNSQRVRTMDELLKVLLDIPNGTYATLVVEEENEGSKTLSIYCNYDTSPLIEYVREGRHWTRTEYGVKETRVVEWDEWTKGE